MRRILLAGATALTSGLVLVAMGLTLSQAAGDKKIVLKLTLPFDGESTVTVDGKAHPGEGPKREIEHKVQAGKETLNVSVLWEPNNYTKITRKKKVAIGDGDTLSIDLSKEDPKNRDDIVVRYVPTPDDVVDEMCRMAKVGKNDIVYDLGCGDARLVITAVKKFNAKKGIGVEYDEKMVKESKENVKKAGLEDKIEIRQGDVLKIKDLADANVVLLYMGEDINLRLRPILKSTLKPGSRIVSHRFTMGDWKPDETKSVDSTSGDVCEVLMWTIKAPKKKQ
jgi:Methyltransferase domain